MNMRLLLLSALVACVAAQNVTFTAPLTPAVNDTLTFQRIARGNVLNVLQVICGGLEGL